jgi:hypothetical protein
MKKTKFAICVTFAALLLISIMVSSTFATTVPTFTLSSQLSQLTYLLPQGTTFNGSISTTGSVRFFVSAPNETIITNLGIIDKPTTFGFVSQQNGTYTLTFENDLPTSIQVTFSYVTDPEISGSNNSTGIFPIYLLIVVIVAVIGSFLIIFMMRRKSKFEKAEVDTRTSSLSSIRKSCRKADFCLK